MLKSNFIFATGNKEPFAAGVQDRRYMVVKSRKQLLKELEYLNDQIDIQVSACGCADYQTLCEYLAVNEQYQRASE